MDESLLGNIRVPQEDEDLWNALHEPDPHPHLHQLPQQHQYQPQHPPTTTRASRSGNNINSGSGHEGMHGMMQGMRSHMYEQRMMMSGSAGDSETDMFLPPSNASSSTGASPLPSLRAHVHLPAISSFFQGIADSARTAVGGKSRNQPTPQHRTNAPDEHGQIHNLDGFLINFYNYFYHKGFWCIAVVEVVSLITGLFSVTLSSFLLGCVQWRALLACHTDTVHGCKQELEQYLTCSSRQPGISHLAVAFYFAMFLLYWCSRVVQLLSTLRDAREMGVFYTQRLQIDERQLQTVAWDEVVNRVLGLVQGGASSVNVPKQLKQLSSYKLQIDPTLLATPHDFARRIMRRENYLIAFMNHALFQGATLLPPRLQFASTAHVMFSRNMECNLSICLIDQLFDNEQNLAMNVLNDTILLQKRLIIAGVVNFVLTPFILLYRVSHFAFQSAQEWHMNRVFYFSSRRWSSYALWKFREYNELPHALEARMARSYPLAEKYLSNFPAGLVGVIAGGISFCASSLMAVLISVSLLEESILLETTFGGRQLLWYLTVATGVFAISRSFTTAQPSPFITNGDCEEAMLQLSAETHYFPKEWRGNCRFYDVRDQFLALFPYKAVLFAEECFSVLMAPYLLCVSLPQCARELTLFIRSHTLAIPKVGAVCRFAEFDFKEYGQDAKMESSFINFKQNHPTWVGAEEGEALMTRLGHFKEEEMEKSMRLGDTMLYGHAGQSHHMLSMSQQLMQSQAIHTALGSSIGMSGMIPSIPQENEFYWLEKLHQRGELGDSGLADIREGSRHEE